MPNRDIRQNVTFVSRNSKEPLIGHGWVYCGEISLIKFGSLEKIVPVH